MLFMLNGCLQSCAFLNRTAFRAEIISASWHSEMHQYMSYSSQQDILIVYYKVFCKYIGIKNCNFLCVRNRNLIKEY